MHPNVIEVMTGERQRYRDAEAERRHRLAAAQGEGRSRGREVTLLFRMLSAIVRRP